MRGRILWYELLTTDMKAAEQFYTAVVGWMVSSFDQSPQPYHMPYHMWMRAGEIPVGGVMTILEGMGFPPHWEMYVGVPQARGGRGADRAPEGQRAVVRDRSAHGRPPMGKYHEFGREWDLGGIMNKSKEMANVPPHWGLYFRVPDVQQGAERVKANDGQVLNGPMEVPGRTWIVNCMDPQGAAFSLHHK